MNKSHRTARARTTLSAPMQWLYDNQLLKGGRMLDFGCGKGTDATTLGMDYVDPFYTKGVIMPNAECAPYTTITCHYVFNVIESIQERETTLNQIRFLLASGGVAYISVRRDVIQEGYTKTGTYQENVILNLPIVHEVKNKYVIYKLTK